MKHLVRPLLQLLKQSECQIVKDEYKPHGHNSNYIEAEVRIMIDLLCFKCLLNLFNAK